MSQNYKDSEAQVAQVGNKFQSLVSNAESGVDSFRVNLTAYGANHGGSVGAFVANDLADKIGQGEGVALEAIDTASGLVDLAHNVSELTSPAAYILDPQSNINRLKTTASAITTVGEVAAAVSLSPTAGYALAKSYASNLYQSFQNDPSKFEGRAGFEVASIAVGGPLAKAGKVSDGLNALGKL
jgi:hypothetical protein